MMPFGFNIGADFGDFADDKGAGAFGISWNFTLVYDMIFSDESF